MDLFYNLIIKYIGIFKPEYKNISTDAKYLYNRAEQVYRRSYLLTYTEESRVIPITLSHLGKKYAEKVFRTNENNFCREE